MPLRYRAPYIPRIYPRRPPAGGGGGGGRGDTASTGNVGGDFAKAITNLIQQGRQNAIANQLMNTQNPPRAGALGPVLNPATGQVTGNITPTGGTSPLTGGVEELQMRQQFAQQNLADQLQQAKIAAQLALVQQRQGGLGGRGGGWGGGGGGGSASRWKASLQPGQPGGQPGGKAGKPAPYVAGSSDPQDPSSDDYNKIAADFNSAYGGGKTNLFNKFATNISNLKPDGKGNLVLTDANGNPIVGKDNLPTYSIPAKDADLWSKRYNAARIAHGQEPLGTLPTGTNPNSGEPSGSQVNPVDAPDNLTVRSLPMNTWFRAPDGSVRQKTPLPPAQGAQPPAQGAQPTPTPPQGGQPTASATDQADQDRLQAEQDQRDAAAQQVVQNAAAPPPGQPAGQPQGVAQPDQGVTSGVAPNPALLQAIAQGQGGPTEPPGVTGLSYLGNNANLAGALQLSQPRDLVS